MDPETAYILRFGEQLHPGMVNDMRFLPHLENDAPALDAGVAAPVDGVDQQEPVAPALTPLEPDAPATVEPETEDPEHHG